MICYDARRSHAPLQIFAEFRLGVGAFWLKMPQTGSFALDRFFDEFVLSRRMFLLSGRKSGVGQRRLIPDNNKIG